jgi:hypothetical protein
MLFSIFNARLFATAVFRNKSDASVANIQPPLIPESKFAIHSVVSNKDLGAFTKEDWNHCAPVQFSGSQTVEVSKCGLSNRRGRQLFAAKRPVCRPISRSTIRLGSSLGRVQSFSFLPTTAYRTLGLATVRAR